MNYDYIIIGAGPAGLQLGYFLHKANKNYVIIEKKTICSFFKHLPRHRKLISFNKSYIVNCDYEKRIKYPGLNIDKNEIHMRYDWNSLICDNEDLFFRNYTDEFFPHADVMVKYMNDFSKLNNLNVLEGVNIVNINKNKNIFHLTTEEGHGYTCTKLIVCTGLSKPNIPNDINGIHHAIGYEKIELNDDLYKGKKLCILGAGNSALETANYMLNKASYICIKSRSKRKLANKTHYVGDIRATHSNFFDVFQFKTLGLFESHTDKFRIRKRNDGVFLVNNEEYDVVIRCLGFNFDDSIFDTSIKPQLHKMKVPIITNDFESINVQNLYFGGSISQYIGYKKNTNGFIHGFRYIMKYLSNLLINDDDMNNSFELNRDNLQKIIFKVINENSCIFQLFENFCYVLLIDNSNSKIIDMKEMPISKALSLKKYDKIIITFEYNLEKRDDQFDSFIIANENAGFISRFFHPVIRYIPMEYDFNDFKEFNDLKYKYNTKIQCICGEFDDYNYINKHTICKQCSKEATCYFCCGKDIISHFKDNKCRKCIGNNSDNVYTKKYSARDNKTIYRFDFMEQPDNVYDYDFNVRPITRYINFLFCNEIINLEKIYLPNYAAYKKEYNLYSDEQIMNNMVTINSTHPTFKDIIFRPFQRNYLFKNCYIYPKNKNSDIKICVKNYKDIEYIENDERRKEGLYSLINTIENM